MNTDNKVFESRFSYRKTKSEFEEPLFTHTLRNYKSNNVYFNGTDIQTILFYQ